MRLVIIENKTIFHFSVNSNFRKYIFSKVFTSRQSIKYNQLQLYLSAQRPAETRMYSRRLWMPSNYHLHPLYSADRVLPNYFPEKHAKPQIADQCPKCVAKLLCSSCCCSRPSCEKSRLQEVYRRERRYRHDFPIFWLFCSQGSLLFGDKAVDKLETQAESYLNSYSRLRGFKNRDFLPFSPSSGVLTCFLHIFPTPPPWNTGFNLKTQVFKEKIRVSIPDFTHLNVAAA